MTTIDGSTLQAICEEQEAKVDFVETTVKGQVHLIDLLETLDTTNKNHTIKKEIALANVRYEGLPITELSDEQLVKLLAFVNTANQSELLWIYDTWQDVDAFSVWSAAYTELVTRKQVETYRQTCQSTLPYDASTVAKFKHLFSYLMLNRKSTATMDDVELAMVVGEIQHIVNYLVSQHELKEIRDGLLNLKKYGVWEIIE